MKKQRFVVGIDTGVKTGFSIWDRELKKFDVIDTVAIHVAMDRIKGLHDVFVRVEDARLRRFFGTTGREKLQGAGSIKRDAKIFEDFLTDLNIPFEMVAPKNNKTKVSADLFVKITGWKERTSVHGRDSAMLVFNL